MRIVVLGLMAVVGVGGARAQDGGGSAARCAEMAKAALPHAVVERAAVASRGELAEMKLREVETLPEFCRVQIVDRPSADSEIRTEVWLPTEWNGKLRAMGNGGFAGAIYFEQMAEAVRQGYATVGTDTGHVGGKGDFALGHPEKVKDFGWRAVHDMTVQAKALVRAFYGRAQEKAYFTSCSDGGREALMEAQRFPGDYDGILAGAPAYNWTALMAGAAEHAKWMEASEGNYLPPEKVPALASAVNAACDAKDGVKDGVVNDPRACGFDPATIACKAGDGADCLTKAEAETVRRIYRGPVNDAGKVMFTGLMPGAEDGKEGWAKWISGHEVGSSMSFFSQSFFGNFIYSRPEWDVKEFDFDRGYKAAVAKTAADLNATDTNIAQFFARGGKLILYHGWNDPAIPALMTVNYYDGVVAKVGAEKAANGVRLYMVPGMQHCAGGPGATEFGQFPGLGGEGSSNVFEELEAWAEKGKVPGVLTATKTEGEAKERKVVMTRPVCLYPQVAKYDGKGDDAKAESFACVAN